jgi:four helix bundle protein
MSPPFVAKLSDSEQEAAETQTFTEFARRCGYCSDDVARRLDERAEEILSQLSIMIRDADRWCLPPGTR